MTRSPPAPLPTVIDVEASGFGPGGYPIEVGVVLPNGKTHCYLIRPAAAWTHWDSAAESVHGIRRELLQARGVEIEQVAHSLNEILRGETVYTDGWGHDRSWLALLFDEAGVSQHFRIESLRALLSEHQVERWQSARESAIRAIGRTRHRASVDALIVQQAYLRTLPDAEAAA